MKVGGLTEDIEKLGENSISISQRVLFLENPASRPDFVDNTSCNRNMTQVKLIMNSLLNHKFSVFN